MALQHSDFNESFWFRKIGDKSSFHYQIKSKNKFITIGGIYLDYSFQGTITLDLTIATVSSLILGEVIYSTMNLSNYEKLEPTKLSRK